MVGLTGESSESKIFIAYNGTPRSTKLARMLGKYFGRDAILRRVRKFPFRRPPRFRPGPSHFKSLLEVHRPLVLGSEICVQGGYGTLGGFVRNNGTGETEIMSCQHVIADCRGHIGGFTVHQPSRRAADAPVASTLPCVAFLESGPNPADIAFGRLHEDNQVAGNTVPRGMGFRFEDYSVTLPPDDFEIAADAPVFKLGKSSGLTEGRVIATRLSIDSYFKYRERWRTKRLRYNFMPTILIESLSNEPFSRVGDSGGLVFCESSNAKELYAIAMVSGSTPPTFMDDGSKRLTRYTWACEVGQALRNAGRSWL